MFELRLVRERGSGYPAVRSSLPDSEAVIVVSRSQTAVRGSRGTRSWGPNRADRRYFWPGFCWMEPLILPRRGSVLASGRWKGVAVRGQQLATQSLTARCLPLARSRLQPPVRTIVDGIMALVVCHRIGFFCVLLWLASLSACGSPARSVVEPPPGMDWSRSPFCQHTRAMGGEACDEHQVSVYPAEPDVVRHHITSLPNGMLVYWYIRAEKHVRLIGRTPFTAKLARKTVGQLSYCAGPCLTSDSARFEANFFPAQPRDLEIRFEEVNGVWQGRLLESESP